MRNESTTSVFAVEVDHPIRGWIRLDSRYRSRAAAREWYRFIKAAWHGLPLRTVPVSVMDKSKEEAAS